MSDHRRSDRDPGLLSRRDLLRSATLGAGALGVSALVSACGSKGGGSSSTGTAPAGSLKALAAGATQLSLLGTADAQNPLPVGRSLFTFGLVTPDNQLISGGSPQVWLAKDDTSKALGPFPATSFHMSAYGLTGDKSPATELTSFYGAEVEAPSAGNWLIVAVADLNGTHVAGQGGAPVSEKVVGAIGSKALSEPTPVAASTAARAKICTRNPPCTMHSISLDKALRSGRPTVISFATPLLCQSRMCGPVVDEQLVAFHQVGAAKANFIHVEEFPTRDPSKPAKAFSAWGFQTEPWVFVIDKGGVIRARYMGPVTAVQIRDALHPLL
ncbi:MAG TPA: hypothetical protein VF995_02775 [Actinomycetota bacterium]